MTATRLALPTDSRPPKADRGRASRSAGAAVLAGFHPAVREWFRRRFRAPTDAQAAGWPHVRSGNDVLIAAPTGSGKTLASFLAGIDSLVRQAEAASLPETVQVVYVSPLKALGNDIHRNLEVPLAEIRDVAREMGYDLPPIRTAVRTGDTAASERQAMLRTPPHILITTPESLFLLLTAERSRELLRDVRTVIVDEIHALARDKRGSHFALTLARLDHVAHKRPARIGLSATQRPIEELAAYLVGSDDARSLRPCVIVDLGHQRDIELHVDVPPTDLGAVAPKEQWDEIYDRLADLIRAHRTTLVFVNTRRLSERVAHNLRERLGDEHVASHHGSLSRDRRLHVEQRLKAGDLKALVATASLELGIDIGSIDLVCQVGSPRSIATFLQRVGRSGHALGLRPHGRLFPTSRDEMVECAALVRAARAGRLDRIVQPVAPLDILAQQVVAETACEEWSEDDLYDLFRRATPYRDLAREDYNDVLEMLSEGVGDGAGRAPPLVHRDRINRVLRARRGSRLTALMNGGAIPELGDYRVVAEPDETVVGSVNEDWAVESMAGDIFLLGSTSWRIKRIESGVVRVENAQGLPPTIPFWLGEAPGRTVELSEEVGQLRRDIVEGLGDAGALQERLKVDCGLDDLGAVQVIDYVRAARDSLGVVPSDVDVVFERFFDDAGGMQLVVHAPFGARINKAWGLALRKRFCVRFDFELQAAASDDAIVLSLGPQHSFPLEESFDYVTTSNATRAVEQSVLYVPLFPTRFRWDASRALAVLRQRAGRKVPPPLQRMRSDDLLAAVFPAQVGCQENVTGPLELPDHPLIRQTMRDCLYEALDIEGLLDVLGRIERGEVRLHARDTVEPSAFAHEILNSKPYTYLDDAPLEERRTRAVSMRRSLPENARDLGALDPEAIARVREEAWPQPRDAEEVHDALLGLVALQETDVPEWRPLLEELASAGRAFPYEVDDTRLWAASESLALVRLLQPSARIPDVRVPSEALIAVSDREDARLRLVRGLTEVLGPVTPTGLAERVCLAAQDIEYGLRQAEAGGFILRGHFSPGGDEDEFCDRRLLARIHRYTLDRLRKEIDPVSAQDYMRFLLRWQSLSTDTRVGGKAGLRQAVARLQGFEAPAVAWERELLPARVVEYRPSDLDELSLAGELVWARLTPRKAAGNGSASPTRATPITLALRRDFDSLLTAVRGYAGEVPLPRTGAAAEVFDLLSRRGALFFDEIVNTTRRLGSDVERGLRELVAWGLVTADGFQGIRQLTQRSRPGARPRSRVSSYGAGGLFAGHGPAGRWALVPTPGLDSAGADELVERVAGILLERYGVVFRDIVGRESFTLPWRDVLRALRRLEARGVIRGGRFVSGFIGEQYALPEAVDALRRVRRQERAGERVWVAASDPANLSGVIVSGPKIPAVAGNAVLFVDGLPMEAGPRLAKAATALARR